MKRSASAVWQGTGKEGKGTLNAQSGILKEAPYGFNTRFENQPGTNPEELLAAAHAGCFTMALAFALNKEGYTANQLETNAAVSIEQQGEGFTIAKSELTLTASIDNIDEVAFEKITNDAKANCPVSKLFNAEITLQAKLEEAVS